MVAMANDYFLWGFKKITSKPKLKNGDNWYNIHGYNLYIDPNPFDMQIIYQIFDTIDLNTHTHLPKI